MAAPKELAFRREANAFVNVGLNEFPSDRVLPPDNHEAAYAQLIDAGVTLPDGSSIVFKPADVTTVAPLIRNLFGEWLGVAVQGMDEPQLIGLLCELTFSQKWLQPNSFVSVDPIQVSPYCKERTALIRSIFRNMLQRKVDIIGFLDRLAANASFIEVVRKCAGDPASGSVFCFWLEASQALSTKAKDGHLVRKLHPMIFSDKMLAIEAARAGNLDVLKHLDADGYDVRRKDGGMLCCGGRSAIKEARANGHTECVTFIDELKLYPPAIKYDPKSDQSG
eukprot:TRINITY_DN46325_c0_g1_i1.p1 TRINITY_DN46325_c0_g1~~TRINITY_DN46325_c0_g1_i1.p1  ORF type:complete len:279 (-),score=32.07 TRINITY_DN46325_c0_g1_i1:216-1052(-)